MSGREKMLGLGCALVGCALFYQRVSTTQREAEAGMATQVRLARERMEASRALMAAAPQTTAEPERRPAAMSETTMRMLKDVTMPVEIREVKVISVDRMSATEYRLTLEGRFAELMRFLSYMERAEGDFRVNQLELNKQPAPPPKNGEESPGEERRLRGVFLVARKG